MQSTQEHGCYSDFWVLPRDYISSDLSLHQSQTQILRILEIEKNENSIRLWNTDDMFGGISRQSDTSECTDYEQLSLKKKILFVSTKKTVGECK